MSVTDPRVGSPTNFASELRLGRFAQYAIVGFTALVGAVIVLQLWQCDLNVPLYYLYRRDTLTADAFIKGLLENGSFHVNDTIGRPFGSLSYDYPTFSLIHEMVLRAMLVAIPHPALVLNLFFILGFPLTALTTYFVMRRLEIAAIPASIASILYAFLPYRLWRNESHIFYSSFYYVPLIVLVTLWIARGDLLFWFTQRPNKIPSVTITRDGWLALLFCAIISNDNIYHAFFSGFLILCATGISITRRRTFSTLFPGIVLIGEILLGLVAYVVPMFLYHIRHGSSFTSPFVRFPKEAELYSLSLAQLVLPIEQHRLEWFAHLRAFYDRQFTTSINENSSVTLGLIATVAFVTLLWRCARPGNAATRHARLEANLGSLTLLAFLLGTFGGLGALFSYYVSDDVRAYNRIAPFIAVMAFIEVAILLERLWVRYFRDRPRRAIYGSVATIAIVIVGILDQTDAHPVPDPARTIAVFAQDQRFVDRIETSVPAGSSIYELPYVRFPEEGQAGIMPDYTEMIPYLHSRTLKWSYGAFLTTDSGLFQAHMDRLSDRNMILDLSYAAFGGIFIFRDGYTDQGAAIEKQLQQILGVAPIVGGDGHYSFFDLANFTTRVRERVGSRRFETLQQAILKPVEADVASGCSYLETSGRLSFQWCGHDATIQFRNPTATPRTLHLSFGIDTTSKTPSNFTISTATGSRTIPLDETGSTFSGDIDLPVGLSTMHLHSDAAPLVAVDDPRELVFRITYFKATDPTQLFPF